MPLTDVLDVLCSAVCREISCNFDLALLLTHLLYHVVSEEADVMARYKSPPAMNSVTYRQVAVNATCVHCLA